MYVPKVWMVKQTLASKHLSCNVHKFFILNVKSPSMSHPVLAVVYYTQDVFMKWAQLGERGL